MIREILHYPDPRLHTVAKPVDTVDARIQTLVDDMAETMYAAHGIGLAATQIDVHQRLIVIDVSETKDQLLVLINPEITEREGETEFQEGCLSVPGIYDWVIRSEKITMHARNRKGEKYSLSTDGLLSICIQHEMDHLLGKVFVDYLSRLKQTRIAAKMKKMERVTL